MASATRCRAHGGRLRHGTKAQLLQLLFSGQQRHVLDERGLLIAMSNASPDVGLALKAVRAAVDALLVERYSAVQLLSQYADRL